MKKAKKKTRRSVPRPGSGRTPRDGVKRVLLSCRVKPETLERLDSMDGGRGVCVDHALEYLFNNPW